MAVISPGQPMGGDPEYVDVPSATRRKMVGTAAALGFMGWLAAPPRAATAQVPQPAESDYVTVAGTQTITGPKIFQASTAGTPLVLQQATGFENDLWQVKSASGSVVGKLQHDGTLILGSDTAGEGSGGLKLKRLTVDGSVAPEIHFHAQNGRASDKMCWGIGIDIAAPIPSRDLVIFKAVEGGGVGDFVYCSHNGASAPRLGIGVVPPSMTYTVQISAPDAQPSEGALAIRANEHNSGKALALIDSANGTREKWAVDMAGVMNALTVRADVGSAGRALTLLTSNGAASYGFRYNSDASLSLQYFTGGVTAMAVRGAGVTFPGTVGFFGNNPVGRQPVVGSRSGGGALQSLITALWRLGLVSDGTGL